MGLEIIVAALIGTALAGLWDLKTTEVPDELPFLMIVVGIGYWLTQAAATGNVVPVFYSLVIGSMLLAVGLALYYKKQWGGADAWILAAIGFMVPLIDSRLFILDYLMNFFVVAAAYMIVYALALGARHRIGRHVISDLSAHKKYFALPFVVLAVLLAINTITMRGSFTQAFAIFVLLLLLIVFWRYARVVEQRLFKKRIPSSELRDGDVLADMKWVGLTKQQVAVIKRTRKQVTIKEGVRFVPVFAITLAVTWLWGNVLFAVL